MSFKDQLFNVMQQITRAIGAGWQQLLCGLANTRRRIFRKRLADYPVLVLDREIDERPPATPWWYSYLPGYKAPVTLESISHALQQVAGDPDTKGVVFLFKSPALSLAQAQSLAALFARFRVWDELYNRPQHRPAKQIVVHLEQINGAAYVVACAADKIMATPLTNWEVLGLYSAPTFLKTTLARLGIAMDVVKIAPWKTAADTFSCAEMSPEYAAQIRWLFDSWYNDIVEAIHKGRKLDRATIETLIDGAPWTAQQALSHGLIDEIGYEDEIPTRLGTPENPATLQLYSRVQNLLWRRPRRRHPQAIGVISLLGAIMPGDSRSFPIPLPLLGERTIGSNTAQQQVRAARQDDQLAAVVVHVDSRGGSALASDLIWRELSLLNATKPVVVYMGDVAASGGYYIAIPGRKIVAQRATLTGSIGVIISKPVTEGAYQKVEARRYAIGRGDHAGLYQDDHAWEGEEREKIEATVRHTYHEFKQRVAEGRALAYEGLDDICNGRVWTGAQALEHGLVDAVGDFQIAIDLACQLANLPIDGTVEVLDLPTPKRSTLAEPAAALQSWLGLDRAAQLGQLAEVALHGEWARLLGHEQIWLIAEHLPKIK